MFLTEWSSAGAYKWGLSFGGQNYYPNAQTVLLDDGSIVVGRLQRGDGGLRPRCHRGQPAGRRLHLPLHEVAMTSNPLPRTKYLHSIGWLALAVVAVACEVGDPRAIDAGWDDPGATVLDGGRPRTLPWDWPDTAIASGGIVGSGGTGPVVTGGVGGAAGTAGRGGSGGLGGSGALGGSGGLGGSD